MRVYWEFGLRSFRRGLAYRLNTLLRVVGTLAYLVIQVAIWRALLSHGAVAGVTQQQMVSYAILSTCITAVRLNSTITRTVDERLNTGNIAIDLIKPLRYPLYLAADGLGSAAYQALFTTLPTLVIAGVAFGFQPPASVVAFLAFLASVALALALSFAIGYLIALCAFWVLTTFHFEWTINTLIKVFSGRFLPFWFFPPWLAAVAAWSPFGYFNFVPVAIYLGRIPTADLGRTLAVGLGWTVLLLGLAAWIWSRSVRRLVVQGG